MWNINDSIFGFTEKLSCQVACHAGEPGKPFGNKYTSDDTELGDIWHMKTVRTGSVGQIDNQPDGMCLDAAGNLYVAHYGMKQVQVLSPAGKLLARYDGGNLTTSNVAFGGPKMDQLFVTGALGNYEGSKGGLFRLDLGVQGLVILPVKK